jgi:hypothetical protein
VLLMSVTDKGYLHVGVGATVAYHDLVADLL